jgi:hypothetical protein
MHTISSGEASIDRTSSSLILLHDLTTTLSFDSELHNDTDKQAMTDD